MQAPARRGVFLSTGRLAAPAASPLGVERTVAYICGLHHVRETIPFARMMERLSP